MGIFSLFGKKERQPAAPRAGSQARKKQAEPARGAEPSTEPSQREQLAQEQRQVARATALKIDAIESEMSSEFVRPVPKAPAGSAATRPVATSTAAHVGAIDPAPAAVRLAAAEAAAAAKTSAADDASLLGDTVFDSIVAGASLEDLPLFEEAAILFANGQTDMVEHLLKDAIENDQLGSATVAAWAMLFDLYQINGDQLAFENLSIAYASRFETSPPAWLPLPAAEPALGNSRAVAVPSVVFSGNLDTSVVKTLEKVRSLAQNSKALRLEFLRIDQVDPVGCGLLLRVLNQLRKSDNDLVLVGVSELVAKVRKILAVGRRDETEAPWLLLLELLALLNQEAAFEEASIDYCITFEVSPPAFVAPKTRVTTAMDEPQQADPASDLFTMPSVIEGRTDALVAALGEFALQHNPARVDCTALARVDVNAAGQLLAGLAPITGDGRVIEFLNVNHLVATLFSVLGLKDVVRVVTRRI